MKQKPKSLRKKIQNSYIFIILAMLIPAVYSLTLARKFWDPVPAAVLFIVLELLAWLAETALLRIGAGLAMKGAILCSLALNAVSCLLGVAVSHL